MLAGFLLFCVAFVGCIVWLLGLWFCVALFCCLLRFTIYFLVVAVLCCVCAFVCSWISMVFDLLRVVG